MIQLLWPLTVSGNFCARVWKFSDNDISVVQISCVFLKIR